MVLDFRTVRFRLTFLPVETVEFLTNRLGDKGGKILLRLVRLSTGLVSPLVISSRAVLVLEYLAFRGIVRNIFTVTGTVLVLRSIAVKATDFVPLGLFPSFLEEVLVFL